jgi:hypothetical protein
MFTLTLDLVLREHIQSIHSRDFLSYFPVCKGVGRNNNVQRIAFLGVRRLVEQY